MALLRRRRATREARLAELDAFRHVRRVAHEDVTLFGEELSELHFDTLAEAMGGSMVQDYQRALDAYEHAKATLDAASSATHVTEVTSTLADGRFAHACVLAALEGRERPMRRPPCFFDPSHGPASRDVEWAPPGGVPREVPVCFRDAERLTVGEQVDVRLVRLGNRRVPWFASGPLYSTWAVGWYDELVKDGRMQADRLTTIYAGPVGRGDAMGVAGAAAWSDPGSWSDGGMIGGHDFSDYGHGGLGDFGGGGDFGGVGDFGGGGGGGGD